MDKKFLHKVLDQIVSETTIDYEKGEIQIPFSDISIDIPHSLLLHHLDFHPFLFLFSDHCKNVYGLNKEETEYVWEEYKHIIIDKLSY
tara:strand:+ start:40 stop:303 length:264 start_codon:yes stop_codon:yes gene_type:complete